jgi:hypothetical protein
MKQCSWFLNEDSLRILHLGARVCAYSARGKVPECIQNNEDSYAQIKKVITRQLQKINFHFIAKNPRSLVQTNQTTCSEQTGGGWNRQ